MAKNNWEKVQPGVGIKNFLGLMAIGTIIISGLALAMRVFGIKK